MNEENNDCDKILEGINKLVNGFSVDDIIPPLLTVLSRCFYFYIEPAIKHSKDKNEREKIIEDLRKSFNNMVSSTTIRMVIDQMEEEKYNVQ